MKSVLFVCVENAYRSQMAEEGIDISRQRPNLIDLKTVGNYVYIITAGFSAIEICPAEFIGVNANWKIPDPTGSGIEEFHRVRDLVRAHVDERLD